MRTREQLRSAGFTLVELVIVVAIVGILAAVVLPLSRWAVKRQGEYELQESLRILRTAIDRYHDMALAGLIEVPPGDTGYPPSLDALVEGVELIGEIPSPVPGAVGAYDASGFGLGGGYAGAAAGQAGGLAGAATGPAGGIGSDPGGRGAAGGRDLANAFNRMQEVRNLSERAGGGLGLSQGGRGLGLSQGGGRGAARGGVGGRGGIGAAGRAPGAAGRVAADVREIVFLRRLPVDPFTGDTDWGLRCYGDSIDDRSWCGRNVFDVYSNARGRAIDGRPYREW